MSLSSPKFKTVTEYLEGNPDVKYILFGGKGGVGKTTLSAATGYWLASKGKRVIVFSTDPQASLSDIFERNIFGKGEVEIAPNYYVLEIDADRKIVDLQEEVRRKIKEVNGLTEIPVEVEDYIRSASAEPAMAESATFDAMVDLINGGRFDYYIFDMMPHGHAVRFLAMAQLLDAWVNKVIELRATAEEYAEMARHLGKKGGLAQEDAVLTEMKYIQSRLGLVSGIIRDRTRSALLFVIIPELLPIMVTKMAMEMFADFQIPASGVVVNQVYPVGLSNQDDVPLYLKNRIAEQQKYLEQIRQEFGQLILGYVPMFDREPKGLEMVSRVAANLFAR